jgi:hypothetical protein
VIARGDVRDDGHHGNLLAVERVKNGADYRERVACWQQDCCASATRCTVAAGGLEWGCFEEAGNTAL